MDIAGRHNFSPGAPEMAWALFWERPNDSATAVASLLESEDPWLVSCAIAAAADLELRQPAGAVTNGGGRRFGFVLEVANQAGADVVTA